MLKEIIQPLTHQEFKRFIRQLLKQSCSITKTDLDPNKSLLRNKKTYWDSKGNIEQSRTSTYGHLSTTGHFFVSADSPCIH